MEHDKLKDLEQIKGVFDKYKVRFLLVYGALLGVHRDGKLLEHDDDIDLAVVEPVDFKTRKEIGWLLYDLGFQPQPIMFNVFGRWETSEMGYNGNEESGIIVCQRNFKFTIFFFKEEEIKGEKYMVCTPRLGAVKLIASPSKFYDKADIIKINKKPYITPYPIKEYLEFTYENWKDKNGRDHGKTFFEMFPDQIEMMNLEGKNNVLIHK